MDKKISFYRYVLLFMLISLLGWTWETVYLSFKFDMLMDRGFLSLPFCPIYGFSVILVYFMIGTPKEGRGILKNIKNRYLLFILYFVLAMAIPTIIELFTGWFFDEVCGIRLWTYENDWGNFRGYISPFITLMWGIALTLGMWLIFPHVKNIFNFIPIYLLKPLAISSIGIISFDFIYSLTISILSL